MPEFIVRFLRFYASVVLLLVSGVLAFGVEAVADSANFTNVTSVPSVSRTAVVDHAMPDQTGPALAAWAGDMHAPRQFATGTWVVRSLAWSAASSHRSASAAKLCDEAKFRGRRPS